MPLAGRLRTELAAHTLRSGRGDDDLVFGRTATVPFARSTIHARARRAWDAENARLTAEAEPEGREADDLLRPLSAHAARHTCASARDRGGTVGVPTQRFTAPRQRHESPLWRR